MPLVSLRFRIYCCPESDGFFSSAHVYPSVPLHAHAAVPTPAAPPVPPKLNGFDAAAQTLTMAFDAKSVGRVFRDPHYGNLPLPDEKVFIVSWVDYCNKYGMGYALTDGSVGVHFNDSTTLVLSPDKV